MSQDLVKLMDLIDCWCSKINKYSDVSEYSDKLLNIFESDLKEIRKQSRLCNNYIPLKGLHKHVEELVYCYPNDSFLRDLLTLFF